MCPVSVKSGATVTPSEPVLHLVVVLVGALAAGPAVAVHGERAGPRDAAVHRPGRLAGIPDVDAAAADARRSRSAWSRMRASAGIAEQRAALGVGAAVAAADVDDPAVGRHDEAVRLAAVGEAVSTAPPLTIRSPGSWRDRGLAVAAQQAGGPLDRAEQVVLDARPRRSSRRCGPCRCRTSGPSRCPGTRRSGGRCRRCRCRRRRAPLARGSAATVWTLPVGRVCHVYQASDRFQRRAGGRASTGWTRSPAATVCSLVRRRAARRSGRAPISWSKNGDAGLGLRGLPMPRKPPPPSTYASTAASCARAQAGCPRC